MMPVAIKLSINQSINQSNSLLTSSKFVFPGVSLARRARLLTRSMQPPPQIQPQLFLAMLTLHTQGLPTHGMMAACLRDILIYSLPHIFLPVSHPNTIHHSHLNVCLIDYLDLNPCPSIVFWLTLSVPVTPFGVIR